MGSGAGNRSIHRLDLVLPDRRKRVGRLVAGQTDVACVIGRSGVTHRKREGDGATPCGALAIVGGFYRPDRFSVRPKSALPLRPLRTTDGWCDAPGDPRYNRPIVLPATVGHERMWRDDGLYDLVLVLDWNYRRRARGRGSAIFFHLAAPDRRPTAGCVAVSRRDMLKLLARLRPGAVMVVR